MAERDAEPLSPPPSGSPSAADWPALEALFARLADLAEGEQQAALAEVERNDAPLAVAARRLLARDRSGADWIGRTVTAVASAASATEASPVGRRVGPYRLVREIGRGGMGVVYEATREDVFTKRVAVKIATGAAYAPDLARRFHDERQILARLEHPSIARLLDGGTTDDGLPYLVMEYVDGVPVTADVEARGVALADRLALFLQVCEAVQYAHENLVIHRDLKPANILVAAGHVRLLDFGIATLMSPADGRGGLTGTALATLDYCSPEQLRGAAVTTRTDVYALGLVLYELLTGERGQRADTSSPLALEQSICETPLPPPSTTTADRGDTVLARRLRGDLDTVVAAATEKDAPRRYASAAALADDLRRHLAHEPIRARAATRWYRTARFLRRRWRESAAAAAMLALVATGVLLVMRQSRQTERRFQQVRQLATTLMTDVHDAVNDLPASTAAQEVILRTAVEYLNGLTAEAAGDEVLQLEIADGYVKVADLAYSMSRPSLSRHDEAARYYERADALIAGVERVAPDRLDVLLSRANLDHTRARFLRNRGQPSEGLALVGHAVTVAEHAMALEPSNDRALTVLSEALATRVATFSRTPGWAGHMKRYVEVMELRTSRRPTSAGSLSDLATAYTGAGTVAADAGDWVDARAKHRRSVELHEQALALEPENVNIRHNLMIAANGLAQSALGPTRGQHAKAGAAGRFAPISPSDQALAEEAAGTSIEHATWLYERDRANPTSAFDYAVSLGFSSAARPIGDVEAIRLLDASIETLRRLVPDHGPRAAPLLRIFYGSRAERWRQRGDRGKAFRDWEAMYALAIAALETETLEPPTDAIPACVNWSSTLAERGDRAAARQRALDAVHLADRVAGRSGASTRAHGWPARARAWVADVHDLLGDGPAAAQARTESRTVWQALAARGDLSPDVLAEARQALSDAPVR